MRAGSLVASLCGFEVEEEALNCWQRRACIPWHAVWRVELNPCYVSCHQCLFHAKFSVAHKLSVNTPSQTYRDRHFRKR